MAEAYHLNYQQKTRKAKIKTDVNKIAYTMFFEHTHKKQPATDIEGCDEKSMVQVWLHTSAGYIRVEMESGSVAAHFGAAFFD